MHTHTHRAFAANVPVPQAVIDTKDVQPANNDTSDTASVTMVQADVHVLVNPVIVAEIPDAPQVIRAEVHTSAPVPLETKESKSALDHEPKSKAPEIKQPSELQGADSDTNTVPPPVAVEREFDQAPAVTTTDNMEVNIEDVEEVAQMANTASDNVSAPGESSGSFVQPLSGEQEMTPTVREESDIVTGTPTTTFANTGDSKGSGDTAKMAQIDTAAEREKRLSALKDAWESQDKDDEAYLTVVL